MRNVAVVIALLCSTAQAIIVADSGRANHPIVIAENASPATRNVAKELAHFLHRISGAKFEITTGSGEAGIVLGTTAQFPQPGDTSIAEALTIRNQYDGREAFVIRTNDKRVLLLGATELGASHAAYTLLESLGCRWLFPAAEWEVIPRLERIQFDLNVEDRPALLSRRIWWGYAFFDRHITRPRDEYNAWKRRNRMATSFSIYCGHAWETVVRNNKSLLEAHPEYLAMLEGERKADSMKFCISNPAARQLVIDFAVEYLDAHPEQDMVSVDPSDGGGHCECDPCLSMGSVSERVFFLANEAAKAVAEKHAGKLVGLYAYNYHSEPPSFDMEPNVYIQLTRGFNKGQWTFDELADRWSKKVRSMGFYDYYSVYLWDWDMPPGGRANSITHIQQAIREYAKRGATSIDCESGNNWGIHGRGYYLANRLMWNPDADAAAILADFYDKAFGPAASVMQRYYERLDNSAHPLISEHLFAQCLRDLQEAQQVAADHPDVLARLDHLKLYWRFVHLKWDIGREKDDAVRKDLTLAALTHVYRSRYSYMNHWEAMRQSWTPKAAKEFEEPSWSFRQSETTPPWKVDEPYTAEEINDLFVEALERFKPEAITESSFSDDLVPVTMKGLPQRETFHRYQNTAPYVFSSIRGEKIDVSVTTGTIAWYRDRPNARYTFTDQRGKEVAAGKLPLDGEKHDIGFKPPRSGRYTLDFNDSGAGWAIHIPDDQPNAMTPVRGVRLLHAGWMQDIYFYVPKRTRQLHYFWTGNEHRVHTPDGEIIQRVDASGKFITIAVPKGADGKVWRFSQMAPGMLWLMNVPNCFTSSPHVLLLPREVVVKDRLRVTRSR